MLKNILTKNGRALLGIAFSFLLSNASLGAVRAYCSWTSKQDQALKNGVAIHGAHNWAAIAKQVPDKTRNQCRSRWIEKLDPAIKNGSWTKKEDQILIDGHKEKGNQWTAIARLLPGRASNQCKYRFVSLTAQNQATVAGAVGPANPLSDSASDDEGFAFPISPSEPASDNEESDSSTSPLEREPAGRYEHGDPDAVAGAVGPASPPPALLAAPLLESEEDEYGDPDAVAGAVGPANPPPPPASSHVPALGLAADGHGVAATGELLAPMVVPVRAAADRDRAAAAGAADPVSPRPSRYRQLRVAVYRGPAAVAGAVGPANPPSNSASDDEDDFANPPPGRLFFEDSRNPFMSEEEI